MRNSGNGSKAAKGAERMLLAGQYDLGSDFHQGPRMPMVATDK
jgi:hypothetical protein